MSASPSRRWVPACAVVHWHGREAAVYLQGEIDCGSTSTIRERLAETVAPGPRRVVLDLSAVTFMDCSGVAEVVRMRRILPADVPLILRSPGRQVRRLLRLTHLDEVCVIQELPRARPGAPQPADAHAPWGAGPAAGGPGAPGRRPRVVAGRSRGSGQNRTRPLHV